MNYHIVDKTTGVIYKCGNSRNPTTAGYTNVVLVENPEIMDIDNYYYNLSTITEKNTNPTTINKVTAQADGVDIIQFSNYPSNSEIMVLGPVSMQTALNVNTDSFVTTVEGTYRFTIYSPYHKTIIFEVIFSD